VTASVLSNFVEICVWSIIQSDNQTVEQAIQTFNSSVEIVSIFSVNITVIIEQIISVVCPGQPVCSANGQCLNSRCVCVTGTTKLSITLFYQFLFNINVDDLMCQLRGAVQ